MKMDDSFKKPGSVPFKWEIRPGVPKLQKQQANPDPRRSEPGSENRKPKQTPFPETPRKLKPPPAGLYFSPQMELRTRSKSFRGSPHSSSNRFGLPGLARPDVVSSGVCFPSPMAMGKLKIVKKGSVCPKSTPDYYSDLESSSRWSVSSRKSVSSSSFASYHSSPRPVRDSDWAGFGLF